MHLIIISILLLLLVGLLFSGSGERRFNNKYLFVFRIFFPSWKFFDNSDSASAVKYRICTQLEEMDSADWRICPPELKRTWHQLLLNPQGNTALACDTVTQHLTVAINEAVDNDNRAEISNSASYKTARNMTLYFIGKTADECKFYQFKLIEKNRDNSDADILISPIYEYNANERVA